MVLLGLFHRQCNFVLVLLFSFLECLKRKENKKKESIFNYCSMYTRSIYLNVVYTFLNYFFLSHIHQIIKIYFLKKILVKIAIQMKLKNLIFKIYFIDWSMKDHI